MNAVYTQSFPFSAGFQKDGAYHGHNYTLDVTIGLTGAGLDEETLYSAVRAAVVSKIDSRDLGRDVEFLKGVELTDLGLLKTFWGRIEQAVHPATLHKLTLEKGKGRKTELLR